MRNLEFFKRAKRAVSPHTTQRTIKVKAEKVRAEKVIKPDGTGKRGRKPVLELRVTKWVRLTPDQMAILTAVKRMLHTNSTSRAIKHCIDYYGRTAPDAANNGQV